MMTMASVSLWWTDAIDFEVVDLDIFISYAMFSCRLNFNWFEAN